MNTNHLEEFIANPPSSPGAIFNDETQFQHNFLNGRLFNPFGVNFKSQYNRAHIYQNNVLNARKRYEDHVDTIMTSTIGVYF